MEKCNKYRQDNAHLKGPILISSELVSKREGREVDSSGNCLRENKISVNY